MEQAVIIGQNERVTPGDFNRFGQFPRDSIDHLIYDAVIPDYAFVGFSVVGDTASALLTVGAGRIYYGYPDEDRTRVFFNSDDGGVKLNMIKDLPVQTLKKFIVYAYGDETPAGGEPRTYLTDSQSRDTVARLTNTVSVRRAQVKYAKGEEAPDPVAPATPLLSVPLAEVLCNSQGIVSITRLTENELPNIRDLDVARIENLSWRARAGTRIDTLGSDISALAQRLMGTASDKFVREIAGDVALMKVQLQLPSQYSSYDGDYYLTDATTEKGHVDNLCSVFEGIRFGTAGASDAQISLLNVNDPKVNVQSNFALPAYDEVIRLPCETAPDTEQSLASYQFVNQQITQKSRTVGQVRYGTEFTVCTNMTGWWAGTTRDYWGNIIKNGVTYQVINVDPNIAAGAPGHELWRLKQVWTEYTNEAYWDVVVTYDNANGSQVSQSFLNTQDGWLTAVDLLITRPAAVGDITVLVAETTNGAPDTDKVLTKQVFPVAGIHGGVNTFHIQPTFLKKGGRYGVFFISSGNHFIGITKNNKYAGGSMFLNSDGKFQVGDLTQDVCFGLRFAKFQQNFLEVDLQPWTLDGGIQSITINGYMIVPDGTMLIWSVLDPANNTWQTLTGDTAGNALNGLPPLVRARVTFVGTPDVMPGIDLSYMMRVKCRRLRPDGRNISVVRNLPSECKNISVRIRLEAWRGGGISTHDLKLITGPLALNGVGDTITTKTAVTETPAPDDPLNAIIRVYTFVLAAGVTKLRLRHEMNTANVLTPFHVAQKVEIDQA